MLSVLRAYYIPIDREPDPQILAIGTILETKAYSDFREGIYPYRDSIPEVVALHMYL
jgi:hypothetical protein